MSRDHDRILEQALKHELRTGDTPVTPACLDAETMAAWEDGGLDAVAMEAAEVHLSTCARCQALAGTMARAIPVTAPVKSDEPFRLWKWWLAPIAAATAAVTIWMVVPAEREAAVAPPAPARDAAVAQVQPETRPFADATASAPAQAPAEAPAAPQKQIDVTLGRVQQRADAPAAESEDRRKRQENLEAKKEDADFARLRDNAVAAAETAVATAAPPGAAGAAPPPPAPAPVPAAPRPSEESSAAAPSIGALQKSARFASGPVEIVSPDPMSRWRTVVTGVERSEDGGRTWIPVRAPGGEIITSGTSPTRNTVWLVGRAGLVLVTVDGFTFARVDLPERADAASITATDARSATVTTTDGRTFRTDDSGRTWRRN